MKLVPQIILAWLLSLIFIYAGMIKASAPSLFYHDIRMYHILSDGNAWYLAHYLPWLEIVVALGLMRMSTRGAASMIISFLLLIFSLAIASAWMRGLNIECGCFGDQGGRPPYVWILIRDLVMLLVALYLLRSALAGQPKAEPIATKET